MDHPKRAQNNTAPIRGLLQLGSIDSIQSPTTDAAHYLGWTFNLMVTCSGH